MRSSDLLFVVLSVLVLRAFGFDITRYDNVAMYWGQNAYGAINPNDTANYQKTLSCYCKDNSTNVIPIAFLNKFFSVDGFPEINLSNICNMKYNATFPGTSLLNCKKLASDIKACQAKGKLITLSLGGSAGNVSFTGDNQAKAFADTVWNLFLGGHSDKRPFGSAVLDGVDLDIESGNSTGYAAFVNRIRYHAEGSEKKYFLTASPQCPYPDATLGEVLNTTWFDGVFVQFYDNYCGVQNFGSPLDWNFGIWDRWVRDLSPNRNVRVYIGAYAGPGNSGTGYVPLSTLASILVQTRMSYPFFGGAVLWDASLAHANGRYDLGTKNALKEAGGVGFIYPACSAYAYMPGQSYSSGQQVSYDRYIWAAKCSTDQVPDYDPLGDWFQVGACQGTPPVQPASLSDPSFSAPPPGALSNGGKSVHGEAYFRRIGGRLFRRNRWRETRGRW